MSSRDYDKLLQAGNAAQLEKLEANSHKKGFDSIDLIYACRRLNQEYHELLDEVALILRQDLNFANIRHEAADIANFAHMIILRCDGEIERQNAEVEK